MAFSMMSRKASVSVSARATKGGSAKVRPGS
jgi:hypothetical protein